MDHVLPEPVAPYERMHVLKPSKEWPTMGTPNLLYTKSWW